MQAITKLLNHCATNLNKAPSPNSPPLTHNGPISISCHIMKEVLSPTAEAELAGLFHNGKDACPMRIA
eukprot:CAMPEP_0202444140 /NCGR_PEP_ID=MMETSP1360-20130828/3282_1 /ASSEMBLY_ACC=CAM_ASM_000848 /TAXON_ID=515479 /ORGANISM="Licmophora paradoxa, Strain CCMP2313" /LENGTH=67 /DNA_ID=CAMNT_0049060051 /DNA_START=243 /DNA_END=443 /DNA_ORIENTATION=-